MSGQRPSWVATVTPRTGGRPLQLAQHVGALVHADDARRRGHQRQRGPSAATTDVEHGTVRREHLALERRRRRADRVLGLHREVGGQARPRGLGGLGEDLCRDLPGRQLLGPPRRRDTDRVHRAIMPGDGDALRHRLGGDRRRQPDVPAIVHGSTSRTWREYDERAARFAGALRRRPASGPTGRSACTCTTATSTSRRSSAGSRRGVPVNVNYRYLDDELGYLLDNADAEALVFHTSLGDRVARVVSRLPRLKLLIEVDDGRPTTAPPWRAPCRGRTRSPPTRRWSASPAARTTSTCSTRAAPPACPRASCTRWGSHGELRRVRLPAPPARAAG